MSTSYFLPTWLLIITIAITGCDQLATTINDINDGGNNNNINDGGNNNDINDGGNKQLLIEYLSQSWKKGKPTRFSIALDELSNFDRVTISKTSTSQNNEQQLGVNEGDRQINDGRYLYALSVPTASDSSPKLMTWALDGASTPTNIAIPEHHHELFQYENTLLSLNKPTTWPVLYEGYYPPAMTVGMQWYNKISATGAIEKSDYWQIEGQLVRSLKVNEQLLSIIKYIPVIEDIPHHYPRNKAAMNANYEYLINNLSMADISPNWSINGESQGELMDAEKCQLLTQTNPVDKVAIFYMVATDMSDAIKAPQVSCVVGNIETVYGSTNALYMSSSSYDSNPFDSVNNQVAWIPPQYHTNVHRFDITETGAKYTASAKVDGLIPGDAKQKAFRFYEKDINHLAVISYVGDSFSNNQSRVQLTILGYDEDKNTFSQVATLPNEQHPQAIGKPGELLYASRFTNQYAYIVTFDKVDPLYAISLEDITSPVIISDLEITGFSDYLHPLTDNNYLLGVGHETIPAANFQFRSGGFSWLLGVKLSLFKQDGTNLTEVDKRVIGNRGSYTPVIYNHHAFTYLDSVTNGEDTQAFRFAVPVQVHATAPSAGRITRRRSSPQYYRWTESVVQVYEVVNEKLDLIATVPIAKPDETGPRYHLYGPDLNNTRSILSTDNVWVLHENQLIKQALP